VWHAVNKYWPSNMLFYRDGVSESQFSQCQNDEILTIKKANSDLCSKDLNLTFVICGKRHHTHFYATNEKDTYREIITIDRQKHENVFNDNGNLAPCLLVTGISTNPNHLTSFYNPIARSRVPHTRHNTTFSKTA
jgi:hypothetical protein